MTVVRRADGVKRPEVFRTSICHIPSPTLLPVFTSHFRGADLSLHTQPSATHYQDKGTEYEGVLHF